MADVPPILLNVTEAARFCRVHRDTVRRWRNAGFLPDARRWTKEELVQCLRQPREARPEHEGDEVEEEPEDSGGTDAEEGPPSEREGLADDEADVADDADEEEDPGSSCDITGLLDL